MDFGRPCRPLMASPRICWRTSSGERCTSMVKVMTSGILGQADATEGPASAWREEVSVRRTHVAGRGGATTSAEDVLAHHELAVVLAHGARRGAKTWIGRVGARSPFPGVAEDPVVRQHRARMR